MKVVVIGRGKMGTLIESTAVSMGHEVVGLYDAFNKEEVLDKDCDVVLDFSHKDNLQWVLDYTKDKNAALVYGTTGLSDEEKQILYNASSDMPVFYASNYSFGVAVLNKVLSMVTPMLKADFDMELVETHHNQKADAPSGTALTLLNSMDPDGEFERVYGREGMTGKRGKEIGVHALRGGTIAGIHEVSYFGKDEVLTFKHTATSRQIFVNGALKAAEFMAGQPAGMYNMDSLM